MPLCRVCRARQTEHAPAFAAFDCTKGQFRLTFLIKEAETIDLLLDDRLVKQLSFQSPTIWRGTVPVSSHTPERPCFLQIAPSGLLGTTVLTFERGPPP